MLYQFQHFGLSEYTQKEYGENLNFQGHLHQSFEFITVLEGEMKITVDNNIQILKEGDSMLVFPNQVHSISSVKSRHMLCIFSPSLVKAYTSKISGMVPVSNKFNLDKHIIKNVDKFNENTSVIEKKGIFYLICAEFDKNAVYTERKDDDKNLLYKIFKFVEVNYNGDCSLQSLSESTGFSYSYLSRYFKKVVGVSLNDYINQYRISSACYILNNTDSTILQCALECGYKSLRSFNRNFMELMAVTPMQYRKKVKN